MIAARAGKVVAGLAILLVIDRLLARIVPAAAPTRPPAHCTPIDPSADADIVIIGDSQSEDADRGRGRSWVSVLRGIRQAAGRDSIASNACGGMRAGDAAARWPSRRPDVVIFWAGWNDLVAGPQSASPRPDAPALGALTRSGFVRLGAALSRDVRRARREASLDALSAAPASDVRDTTRVAAYGATIRQVHRRATASGTSLVLVSPPWSGTTLDRPQYRSLTYQTGRSVATIAQMHGSLLATYHQLCRELTPVTCYDAAAAVDALPAAERRRLFADPLHWSAEGSVWVAHRIDSVLRVMDSR